jgi:hypothetical protein
VAEWSVATSLSLIELTDLQGREKLKGYDVESIVAYEGK